MVGDKRADGHQAALGDTKLANGGRKIFCKKSYLPTGPSNLCGFPPNGFTLSPELVVRLRLEAAILRSMLCTRSRMASATQRLTSDFLSMES